MNMKKIQLASMALLLLAATGGPAAAQSWDTSGNGQLNGTYYFREVFYLWNGDALGDLGRVVAMYGNVIFSGTGTYTLNCQVADTTYINNYGVVPCTQWLPAVGGATSGTYSISASGYGFLSNPLSPGDSIYGLVSQQNIFVGSSTESGLNDLFVAAPLSTPMATNASFNGSYSIADLDLSSGSAQSALSYMFQVRPNGAGSLGSVSATGYVGSGGSSVITQNISNVAYNFSNGAANLAFPNSASLISGQKFLYISPDGNFVFGGSPTAWDFFVGVRTGTGATNFGGLGVPYYQAGIDEPVDNSTGYSAGYLDTYYGAVNGGGGSLVGHQRLSSIFNSVAFDYTYSDTYTANASTYSTSEMSYAVGAGGAVRIGSGIGPYLGLNVALAAPALSGTGVFLNPEGIVNAASFAPFTAAIAPGEFITLYGTGMAPSGVPAASTIPFPTKLGGVQVMIGGIAAPLDYVSPGLISAVVPYGIGSGIVGIQVINNQVPSNTVTVYTDSTAPGVFTLNQNGLGYGAAQHNADYSLVTPSNPAQPGEYLILYLSGLGAVNPAISDGAAGPAVSPYSLTTNTIDVYIGGQQATVVYAGLAPGLVGLYQVDVQVPTGLTAGDNTLEIAGLNPSTLEPESDAFEALIPVGAGAAASVAAPSAAAGRVPARGPAARPFPALSPAARPSTPCGLGPMGCAGRPRSSRGAQ
jgi:uncharacterized protein (TIGR03437 family)